MQEFLIVAGIHLLAVMSPGPDFAMVLRNSLVYSRRTGIFVAIGLALGIVLHISYSLLGIGLIISKSIALFNSIKLLGAAYLIYMGIKALLQSKKAKSIEASDIIQKSEKDDLTARSAIKLGFLTNALNPKATLFFLALFTQVIDPATPVGAKLLYGTEMSIATFAWFSLVAVLLTHKQVNNLFSGIKQHLDRVFGVILIALGLKVATESSR